MLSEYDIDADTGLGTLVFIEISKESVSMHTAKMLSELRKITDDRIFGVMFGPDEIKSLYDTVFSYGVDTLFHVKCDFDSDIDAMSDTMKDISDRINPMAICISGTEKGNILAEKTAFRLGKPLMRNGTEITIENGMINSNAEIDFVPMFNKHNRFPAVMTFKPDSFAELIKNRRTGTVIYRPLVNKTRK